jgi:hypothetical protein
MLIEKPLVWFETPRIQCNDPPQQKFRRPFPSQKVLLRFQEVIYINSPASDDFHWTPDEEEVFTEFQRTMVMDRIDHHTTYRQLQENYRLSGPAQIRSILGRTMHGNRYELG